MAENSSMTGLWQAFLSSVREKVSGHVYSTWFERLSYIDTQDGIVLLEVEDRFQRDWIVDNYLSFMEEAGLNARDLIDAEEAGTVAQADLDPDRRWVADRGRDSHDLFHVLTGYGRDEAGEVGLLAFTYAVYPNPGIGIILLASLLIGPKTWNFVFERYLLQARRRGKAADLDFAPYEEWLPLPIEEARRRAGIIPPERAHPTTGILEASREGGGGMAFDLRS